MTYTIPATREKPVELSPAGEQALETAELDFQTSVDSFSLKELRELCPDDDSEALDYLEHLAETSSLPKALDLLREWYKSRVEKYYFEDYMEDAVRNLYHENLPELVEDWFKNL